MISNRTRRIIVALGGLAVVLLLGAVYGAFQLTRMPDFEWEIPNVVEAGEAHRKINLYETSFRKGASGYVRLSQLEINSYFKFALTNEPADPGPARLTRVGVDLTNTNITLYSWAESRFLGAPVRFVVQRGFHIEQHGSGRWDLPMDFVKIGEVEIRPRFWPKLAPTIRALDQPLIEHLSWATNVQALLVTKNEVSQRPELRLYTYKPIPPEDLR